MNLKEFGKSFIPYFGTEEYMFCYITDDRYPPEIEGFLTSELVRKFAGLKFPYIGGTNIETGGPPRYPENLEFIIFNSEIDIENGRMEPIGYLSIKDIDYIEATATVRIVPFLDENPEMFIARSAEGVLAYLFYEYNLETVKIIATTDEIKEGLSELPGKFGPKDTGLRIYGTDLSSIFTVRKRDIGDKYFRIFGKFPQYYDRYYLKIYGKTEIDENNKYILEAEPFIKHRDYGFYPLYDNDINRYLALIYHPFNRILWDFAFPLKAGSIINLLTQGSNPPNNIFMEVRTLNDDGKPSSEIHGLVQITRVSYINGKGEIRYFPNRSAGHDLTAEIIKRLEQYAFSELGLYKISYTLPVISVYEPSETLLIGLDYSYDYVMPQSGYYGGKYIDLKVWSKYTV